MSERKNEFGKQGNVFISVGIIILVIIFVITFLLYCQVNIVIENVRQDLFYASNNALLSFDAQELSYNKYMIDEAKIKQIIESILNKNYAQTEGGITKIQVIQLDILNEQDKVNIKIQVEVNFESVINIAGKNEHSFKMYEDIRISLLEYSKGEKDE